MAYIYVIMGDYDLALKYCKESLSNEKVSKLTRMRVFETLVSIYYFKNELSRVLKYQEQSLVIAEEENILLIPKLRMMGRLYMNKGEYDKAIIYLKSSLARAENWGYNWCIMDSLTGLIFTHLANDSRKGANRYYTRLIELHRKGLITAKDYLYTKAFMMRISDRMRDRVEAQTMFKQIADDISYVSEYRVYSMVNRCDLLLEELNLYNDSEILKEIDELIVSLLNIAEKERNYKW
ncbi:MAG: tetratricopeptide repeat protein [Candidatus Thorarchaeota archaeon]